MKGINLLPVEITTPWYQRSLPEIIMFVTTAILVGIKIMPLIVGIPVFLILSLCIYNKAHQRLSRLTSGHTHISYKS